MVGVVEQFPSWRQIFAVAAPWRVELNEPWVGGEDLTIIFICHEIVEVGGVEACWTRLNNL